MRSSCRIAAWLISAAALTMSGGCARDARLRADDPSLAGFLELTLPRKIQIQRYLTKPVSIDVRAVADGIEVIVSVLDAQDDPVKCFGQFTFELYARKGSTRAFSDRLAYWSASIDSESALREYWDRMSRFYTFRLRLPGKPLVAGHYTLSAQLDTTAGRRVFDEYEFEFSGPPVPSATPRMH